MKYISSLPPEQAEAILAMYGRSKGTGENCAPNDLVYEGTVQEPNKNVKIGRNDLCPCGSGKKYKKCCGRQ